MVGLPKIIMPTIENVFDYYEKNSGDWRRNHLGASLIGKPCERELWYTFRWCLKPDYSGRLLRLFETGNKQEPRIIKNLRDIGCTVYSVDPDTGIQIHYESFGGHFAGNLDGIGRGFEESKAWHVIEIKTSNTKRFNELCKKGVESANYPHYAQMQMYMDWSGLDRAYYFCVNKETDDIYGERVRKDSKLITNLHNKAERIIFSDIPGECISDSTTVFTCKFCNYRELCNGKLLPEVSCRTCAHASVERNGTWSCKGNKICSYQQRIACDKHVFLPSVVPLQQTDADEKLGTITYGNIVNGPGNIASVDLHRYMP